MDVSAQKSVLITGCSEGGIGDALAKAFHSRGLCVIATARDLKKIEHLRALGIEHLIPLDVVDPDSISEAVATVSKFTGGTLDFLVNNSGAGYNMPLLDTTVARAQALFDLNVIAPIAVTQAFIPLLISAQGTVINMGSVAGFSPIAWQGYYNASKAALNLLTDNMRVELKPLGVKVILVVAGGVRTRFFDNMKEVMPDDSLYKSAGSAIDLNSTSLREHSAHADEFAQKVVTNALSTWPSVWQLAGRGSTRLWFLKTFFWHTAQDLVLGIVMQMGEVTKKMRAARQKD